MSAWKPGDVAMVNTGDAEGVAVVRHHHDDPTAVFVFADHHFYKSIAVDNNVLIKSARPLVVIDPEDREQVERLVDALADEGAHRGRLPLSDAINGTQAALRSLLAPPKPDEPTDFACRAVTDGTHWARILTSDGPRWVTDGGVGVTWDELVRDHPDVEVQR